MRRIARVVELPAQIGASLPEKCGAPATATLTGRPEFDRLPHPKGDRVRLAEQGLPESGFKEK
jgi:hypothetical protein